MVPCRSGVRSDRELSQQLEALPPLGYSLTNGRGKLSHKHPGGERGGGLLRPEGFPSPSGLQEFYFLSFFSAAALVFSSFTFSSVLSGSFLADLTHPLQQTNTG